MERLQVRGPQLIAVLGDTVAALLEPTDPLFARAPLASAQEHPVWERQTEAPVVDREQQFIGAISSTHLRRAQRHLARGHHDRESHAAEVTDLLGAGAGTLWQSLGELVREKHQRSAP
jgi:hypothetical protein